MVFRTSTDNSGSFFFMGNKMAVKYMFPTILDIRVLSCADLYGNSCQKKPLWWGAELVMYGFFDHQSRHFKNTGRL